MIVSVVLRHCPPLPKIKWTYLDFVSNDASAADKATYCHRCATDSRRHGGSQRKQGCSQHLSPTPLSNVVKDIIGQPLAQKKSTINNQKAKTVKRIAEVWQQLLEEDGNAVMAMATATGMRTAMGTLTAMAMAMVTVTVTAMVTATATGMATAMATEMVTSRAKGTAMAVAAAVAKNTAEG